MDFYERFELLELVKDDGVKTFEAREIATGRPVRVHLFVAPKAPLQAALLKALDQLPEEEAKRILTRGKNEGTPYIVTDRLVDHKSMQDWVLSSVRSGQPGRVEVAQPALSHPLAQAQPQGFSHSDLGSAGAWKVPSISNMAPGQSAAKPPAELVETAEIPRPTSEPVAQPQPNPVRSAEMSEFTRMFQSPGATASPNVSAPLSDPKPSVSIAPPIAADPVTPVASTPAEAKQSGQEPSEFTKMFQAPAAVPASAPPSKFPAPAARGPQPRPNEPGEFTRMFHSPAAAPPGAVPSSSAASTKKGPAQGEFTRMFQSPAPPTSAQTSAQNTGKPAGEFTRMFQRPVDAPAEAANAAEVPVSSSSPASSSHASPPAGEFTRFFESPAGPMPQNPAVQQPLTPQPPGSAGGGRIGEFTRMFGQNELPANPAAIKEGGGATPGSATGAFSAPAFPTHSDPASSGVPSAAPVQTGPGEYTRMFTAPAELTLGQAPPAGSPSAAGGSALPMPQVSVSAPQVSAPQVGMPQVSAPQVYAPQVSAPQVSAPYVSAPSYSAPSVGQASVQPLSIAQPSIPQPQIRQPSFPQPSGPSNATASGSAKKSNMVLILGLVGLVVLALLIVAIFAIGKR